MEGAILALAATVLVFAWLLDQQSRRTEQQRELDRAERKTIWECLFNELAEIRKERQNLLQRIQDPVAGVASGWEWHKFEEPDPGMKGNVSEQDEIEMWDQKTAEYLEEQGD